MVTLRSRPNGLPIATTRVADLQAGESPSGSGTRAEAGAVTFSSATSVELSTPTTFAGTRSSLENDTVTAAAVGDDVGVGDDVALPVEHEPRPSALPWLTWTTPGAAAS